MQHDLDCKLFENYWISIQISRTHGIGTNGICCFFCWKKKMNKDIQTLMKKSDLGQIWTKNKIFELYLPVVNVA